MYSLDRKNDKSSKINIDLIDNSPFYLRDGPQDTPYEGGHQLCVPSFLTIASYPPFPFLPS
jgi:ubiquitin-conjugating enzyme (huntingtin interacting protein 2)